MSTDTQPLVCLNCERTVDEVPLLALAQRMGTSHICPQCLPILIHNPQQLLSKLPGAEALHPHQH
jgi:hypothetical protein